MTTSVDLIYVRVASPYLVGSQFHLNSIRERRVVSIPEQILRAIQFGLDELSSDKEVSIVHDLILDPAASEIFLMISVAWKDPEQDLFYRDLVCSIRSSICESLNEVADNLKKISIMEGERRGTIRVVSSLSGDIHDDAIQIASPFVEKVVNKIRQIKLKESVELNVRIEGFLPTIYRIPPTRSESEVIDNPELGVLSVIGYDFEKNTLTVRDNEMRRHCVEFDFPIERSLLDICGEENTYLRLKFNRFGHFLGGKFRTEKLVAVEVMEIISGNSSD